MIPLACIAAGIVMFITGEHYLAQLWIMVAVICYDIERRKK